MLESFQNLFLFYLNGYPFHIFFDEYLSNKNLSKIVFIFLTIIFSSFLIFVFHIGTSHMYANVEYELIVRQ